MQTLLIDNYDSYTFNLYQLIAQVYGEPPVVIRNDDFNGSWERCKEELVIPRRLAAIVISPGPGHPERVEDFGICAGAIRDDIVGIPILGVCLGHQGIAHVLGGEVVHAPVAMHGRVSQVLHDGLGLFQGIPSPFAVVRYHSLAVPVNSLPPQLKATAFAQDDLVLMALSHVSRPLYGLQFHPESICTEFGFQLLENFRQLTIQYYELHPRIDLRSEIVRELFISEDDVTCDEPEVILKSIDVDRAYTTLLVQVIQSNKEKSFPDAETAFGMLYSGDPLSWWLDSSNLDQSKKGKGSGRKCAQNSRFSFMGGDSSRGRLHAFVEYWDITKTLTVSKKVGDGGYHKEIVTGDVFEFLEKSLEEYKPRTYQQYLCKDGKLEDLRSDVLPFNFHCGWVGVFGYDSAGIPGHAPEVERKLRHDFMQVPDSAWVFADRMLAWDHESGNIYLLALTSTDEDRVDAISWFEKTTKVLTAPIGIGASTTEESRELEAEEELGLMFGSRFERKSLEFVSDRGQSCYLEDIASCNESITDGESYEICLTNQHMTNVIPDPWRMYRTLRRINPAPYAAYLHFDPYSKLHADVAPRYPSGSVDYSSAFAVACSSPERFIRIDATGWVESKPIKGTLPRGENPEADERNRLALENSEKDRAENLMIVDLVRNDLGRVCEVGSISVPSLMAVESYATVHQLVSTIKGRLKAGSSAVDCIRAAFPGGSMTGAPKLRTCDIISQLEGSRSRGLYSGALGYLSINGAVDLNIVIRSAVLSPAGTTVGSGGAIIALSDPESEYAEMLLKARPVATAVAIASNFTDCVFIPEQDLNSVRSSPVKGGSIFDSIGLIKV